MQLYRMENEKGFSRTHCSFLQLIHIEISVRILSKAYVQINTTWRARFSAGVDCCSSIKKMELCQFAPDYDLAQILFV